LIDLKKGNMVPHQTLSVPLTSLHCRILSSDEAEWWLISATLCRWRCCFLADRLLFITCIRDEERKLPCTSPHHFCNWDAHCLITWSL